MNEQQGVNRKAEGGMQESGKLAEQTPLSGPQTSSQPATGVAVEKNAGFLRTAPGPGTKNYGDSFFQRVDWLALLLTFLCVWVGYYLTLAPEVTLEDSGELATGSFYAGIPHPPGYPVWTLYTWLWTMLVPVKNVAWRVALGEATSGALAAGLLAMLVCRGSALLIDGLQGLKGPAADSKRAICLVAAFVSGLLLGFNGFMWSQSVIVEVYSFSVASLMVVLLCLLRWSFRPRRWRYLFLALFFHGICFTNHQTLVVAAMGIEVVIAAVSYRMGRYLFLGNSILYIGGLILKQQHVLTAWDENPATFVIFNVVGIASIGCYIWFTFLSNETPIEFCLDAALAGFFLSLTGIVAFGPGFSVVSLAALAAMVFCAFKARRLGWEWLIVIGCGCCWILGAAFYFYMPLAGMTNPPMEWGYPRTVDGFIHAFTRGQYEKTHPTDILHDPLRFITQLSMLGDGIIEEFNWVYAFLALVPFAFFFRLPRRDRAWLIGISAIYLCLGVLLLILLNPPPDRAAQQLVRVFFTASHTIIALLVGYSIALICASMAAHYASFRFWGIAGGAVAVGLAIFSFADLTSRTFFGEGAKVGPGQLITFAATTFVDGSQYGLPVFAGLILIGITAAFVVAIWRSKQSPPLKLALALVALMPAHPILTHWADNEQRNHWFGYYYGHDMFKPPFDRKDQNPLYPEMPPNAVLFGGTDPGRFCPTYMIFCDSFIAHSCQPAQDRQFDRRDAYLITQNALADGTYLEYIRAQYNRSAQVDPPFFQELFRSEKERSENTSTNALARAVMPLDTLFESLGARVEKRRRTFTSWFKPEDFVDIQGFLRKLRPRDGQDALSKYLYDRLRPETQARIGTQPVDHSFKERLAADLNRVIDWPAVKPGQEPLYDAARFQPVQLSEYLRDFLAQNPQQSTRVRLNRLLLEAAYPGELARSPGGVYPDREIYIPSNDDFGRSYNEYARDVQRRLQLNQLKPGEDIKRHGDRVQISGSAAVMGINAILAKIIFENNPKNDFFVEESFPLDWMYPYLSPYGIIMRINRQVQPELTEETVATDHEFWTRYSARLTGNWINYDTPVQQITSWAERTYLRRNFKGFTGDRRFIRDDQAQKSFSKLRGAIAGLYSWRIATSSPGSPQRARMLREADFAYRQAFAFCPYNSEVLFRYVTLLLSPEINRYDDALELAKTSQKLDPFNTSISDLVTRIQQWKVQRGSLNPTTMEQQLEQNPGDFQLALNLASEYFQLGQTNAALQAMDKVLNGSNVPPELLRALVPVYSALSNRPKLERTVELLAHQFSGSPSNLPAGLGLAEGYRALQQTQQTVAVLDQMLAAPATDPNALLQMAQVFVSIGDYQRLENALQQLTQVVPASPEAWYDLAALRCILGKTDLGLQALERALSLSTERRRHDPKAHDLFLELQRDPRFDRVRNLAEFKRMAEPK
ncbi:MAG TPA: DUF2723 domain-containing protein [Verrucomicrobiae bacterium]|nr:DUF2723 domain-containing protein [Verrucomicrobiae bacterium]